MDKNIDKRKFNRGHKGVSGRKSKSDEIKLIERLTPMADEAFKQLQIGVKAGDYKFVQLYLAYFAGRPKETKDINVVNEQPLFEINYDKIVEDIIDESDL
tara:strand:- start:72 stop:371 length:300 start_codon:yes stop_codon:yes gene_type:complete